MRKRTKLNLESIVNFVDSLKNETELYESGSKRMNIAVIILKLLYVNKGSASWSSLKKQTIYWGENNLNNTAVELQREGILKIEALDVV